ncbi:MAG: hypothetical protein G8345_14620, partial [Magnetococcales bacterium]|nr:hypothetical protein [Magnetococcales bacterium]
GRQVAPLARQIVRRGVGQSLAISGLIPSPALLLFWQHVWRVLLVDGVQDLAKAVAVGRAAMASLAGEEHWQSILVFTRLAPKGQVEFNRIHLLPLKDPRFLYAGERIRGINGREIFRHKVWQQVEGAFLQGKRLVGLTGPAGAGKSVMAHLLMERLHRHPQLSEEGRRVVWLNAGVHGGTPSLWQHLADLFSSHGFHADPHWLEEQTKPSPLQLALMFKRLMGSHGWLVVDQCHATQRPEGGWRDPDMAALLTALITQTGWRCLLTSRAPFDLCHDHNSCAIHWLTIPTLTWTERAALAVSEQEVGVLSDPHYLADRLVSMVWWGDPYPLHFRLSLREVAPIMAVEEEANERLHQLLKGLLAQADPAVGFLLQILSLLHFVPEVTHLGGIWRMVGAKAGWQRDMYAIHVGQLEAMGLVEIMPSGRIWMASSVREWVAESIDPVSSELLQRDLAILFHQYSEQIMGEATSLQPMAGKKRGDGEVLPATLFRKAGRMLDYALLHALQQSDTELIAYIFQDVLEQETSHVYRGRLFRQAMEFWQILEGRYGGHQQGLAISAGYGVAAKAFILVGEEGWASRAMGRAMDTLPADAPPELAGGLYYQWGLLHQSTKEWGKAEEALQQALLHFQAARHGHGESSVRRVLQHLAEKRGASS